MFSTSEPPALKSACLRAQAPGVTCKNTCVQHSACCALPCEPQNMQKHICSALLSHRTCKNTYVQHFCATTHAKTRMFSTSESQNMQKHECSALLTHKLIFPSESQYCFELYFARLHMSPEGDICKSSIYIYIYIYLEREREPPRVLPTPSGPEVGPSGRQVVSFGSQGVAFRGPVVP